MDHRQESLILNQPQNLVPSIRSLRDYQEQSIDVLWPGIKTRPRQLCVLPTATGKGVILDVLMEKTAKLGIRSILLLNRDTLIAQFIKRLSHLSPGVFSAGQKRKEKSELITIASIQSCSKHTFEDTRLIIMDEAHNISDSYERFYAAHPDAKIIGFTATPYKESGFIYGPGKFFPRIDIQRSMKQMIDEGYIVPPISRAPPHAYNLANVRERGGDYVIDDLNDAVKDVEKVNEQVLDVLRRAVGRNKIVWACVSIEHAEIVQKSIKRFEDATILHSKLEGYAKDLNLKCFEDGPIRHMVTVMMVSEGYDYAPIDCIVLMRPTKSARLYVQLVGRGLRLHPGKTDCLILDYGNVIQNLGSVADPVILDSRNKSEKPMLPSTIKICPSCFTMINISVKSCDCGYSYPEPEPVKNLDREASSADILVRQATEYQIKGGDVSFAKHIAKSSGNKCIRVDYRTGMFSKNSEFFSSHPYSFSKAKIRLKYLTGFDFSDFNEAFEACENLICQFEDVTIVTEPDGKYTRIKSVRGEGNRAPDSDVPF